MTSTVSKTARKSARPSASGADPVRAKAASPSRARRKKSKIDEAITKKLAAAAAIALLEKTEHSPDALAPAMEILGAGVSRAHSDAKIRVQLAFDGGEILPVEMSAQAGRALAAGLTEEIAAKPKAKKKAKK